MFLQEDLTVTDLGGRLLQQTGRSGSSMDNPFADIGFYSFAGLGLGLMIGIFCGLRSICWPDIDARNDASEDEIVLAGQVIESTLAQRKRTILELFRTSQVTMKVIEEDIHGPKKEQQCIEDMLESSVHAAGTLSLSRVLLAATNDKHASTPNTNNDHASFITAAPPEMVPNCCAICLESYQPGEVVAWSCSCNHVFHQDCIAQYFSNKRMIIGGATPCPCCRQTFFQWPEDEEPRKPPPSDSSTIR